jgi:hypothetical protein
MVSNPFEVTHKRYTDCQSGVTAAACRSPVHAAALPHDKQNSMPVRCCRMTNHWEDLADMMSPLCRAGGAAVRCGRLERRAPLLCHGSSAAGDAVLAQAAASPGAESCPSPSGTPHKNPSSIASTKTQVLPGAGLVQLSTVLDRWSSPRERSMMRPSL